MVATIVLNSFPKETDYDDISERDFDEKNFLTVMKLTAILKVAAGMALSPRKKYSGVRAQIKDKELQVTIDADADLTLEKGLFSEQTDMFEEVFGIRPVVRMKNGNGI